MNSSALFDPKGLIRDAFAIEGISAPECRSIFLDWALGVPAGRDVRDEAYKLWLSYRDNVASDHPMLATLHAATEAVSAPRRRGGRSGRGVN